MSNDFEREKLLILLAQLKTYIELYDEIDRICTVTLSPSSRPSSTANLEQKTMQLQMARMDLFKLFDSWEKEFGI